MKNLLYNFIIFFLSYRNKYREDFILQQERFEPQNWGEKLDKQLEKIKLLNYKISIEKDYIDSLKKTPVRKGFTRVVIPKISFLGKILNINDPYENIGELIEFVCSQLYKDRDGNFTHYRKGALGRDRVRFLDEIKTKRIALERKIPGDLIVLDVDTGAKYSGWTPRRAREEIINSKREIALNAVDLCWIILLNPSRFAKNTDLSVDSVSEIYLSEDRGWVTNLFFYYRGGKLEFGYRWSRRAYFDCGAAIAEEPLGGMR